MSHFHASVAPQQQRISRRPGGVIRSGRPTVIRRVRVREPPAKLKETFEENSELVQDVVSLPPAKADDVLTALSPAANVLNHGTFVIGRQLEAINLLIGFEQANKYAVRDVYGQQIGQILEHEAGMLSVIQRQLFRTHRQFTAFLVDANGNLALKIYRPFTWINSKVYVFDPEDNLIGEVHQIFHIFRRQYELFVNKTQFARIDAPFLSWDFTMTSKDGRLTGTINRNFSGFVREIFTDTGVYVLRMDGLEQDGEATGLSLDERSVALAAAVTIDFDFFSRHSSGSGGSWFLPFWIFGDGE
ncbi:Scramblase-domain-containing protein [Hyaloraphidium curvatum]|nr:Scramblase-domain-containing protein [Hyaloraphidium curvatum]